jgi:hypothetical protein
MNFIGYVEGHDLFADRVEVVVTDGFTGNVLLKSMPTLLDLKRRGRREYGVLAARYTSEFHEKWIEGAAPAGEPLLGSSDIQSLADLANSYTVVGEMKPVPYGRDTIVQVAGAAIIPLLPLVLSIVPADEIIKKLFTLLL